MIKKIASFFVKFFAKAKEKIMPTIDKELDKKIDEKVSARKELVAKEQTIHSDKLNSYLKTYFAKKYDTQDEMQVAFDLCNKNWKNYCRKINGNSTVINLNKKAFENQVKLVITKIKENGTHNK